MEKSLNFKLPIKTVLTRMHTIFKIPCFILLILLINCSEKPQAAKEDTKKGEVLLELVENNLNGDFNKADNYLNDLFDVAKKENDTLLLVKAYLSKGILLTNKGDYQNAIDNLQLGIDLIDIKTNYELYNTFRLRIGNAYVLYGNDKKALSYYAKVYESAFKKNHSILVFKASVNIAKVKRNAGKYQEALEVYKNMYKTTQHLDIEKKNVARVLMGIGGTFLKLNKPDSTLLYSNKGLIISNKIQDSVGQSYFYNDIGIAHFLKKDHIKALDNLERAKKYIERIGNNERLAESFCRIGQCYYEVGDYQQALHNLERVIVTVDNSKEISNSKFKPLELLDAYELLSKSHQALGNTDQALLAEKAVSSLNKIITKENYNVIEAIHNSDLRIRDNIIDKIKVSNEKALKQNRWLLFGIVVLCLVSGISVFYYKKKIRLDKKMFEDLLNQKQTPVKQSKVKINDSKIKDILGRLNKLEAQEFFKEITCNLTTLSKKAKTNPTYLSKILKEQKEKTFYEYINELRISYAINRIKSDKQFRKYDIKHIAKAVGYKSPESFTKHFKKTTGIYPSYFIKEFKKLKE